MISQLSPLPATHDTRSRRPGAAHVDYALLMSLALDKLLEPAQALRLQQHLRDCELCAQEWQIWQGLHQRFAQAPAAVPAAGFGERFEARRLLSERRRRLWLGVLVGMCSITLWGVSLVGLAVAGAYLMASPSAWLPALALTVAYWLNNLGHWLGAAWQLLAITAETLELGRLLTIYGLVVSGVLVVWSWFLRRFTRPISVDSGQA